MASFEIHKKDQDLQPYIVWRPIPERTMPDGTPTGVAYRTLKAAQKVARELSTELVDHTNGQQWPWSLQLVVSLAPGEVVVHDGYFAGWSLTDKQIAVCSDKLNKERNGG